MMLPITIVGGGLAGLALGIGLRNKGVPVTLFESGIYPRHRVCGEFMTNLSPALLENLDLIHCFKDSLTHRTSMWYYRGRPVRRYILPVPAIGISRYTLDCQMAEYLKDLGGIVEEGNTVSKSTEPGSILAAGRKPGGGGFIGLKGHWNGLESSADLELHMGRHAYMGVSRVEAGYFNVCGLFRNIASGHFQSPLDRFHATLDQHGLCYLSDRLKKSDLRAGSLCSVSGLSYSRAAVSDEANLGDHHRMIPPFTGHGMTIALESVASVLPALVDYCSGNCSWSEYVVRSNRILSQRFNRRYGIAGALHPFIMDPRFQPVLVFLSRLGLLPFQTMYRLTH